MAPTATDRLRRLLALVPWVAAHPEGVPIAEVCARFEIAPDRLVADLETVMMVGVHPFTPDTLIDLWLDDGVVTVRYADSFTRPLRLTPAEAVDLVTSARALLAPRARALRRPLPRALDKLAEVLGPDALAAVDVTLAKRRRGRVPYHSKRGAGTSGRSRSTTSAPDTANAALAGSSLPASGRTTGAGTWPAGATLPRTIVCSGSIGSPGR